MKIALASFLFDPEIGGGAVVVANQLADALSREHLDVVILTTWAGHGVRKDVQGQLAVIRLPAHNLYWVADKEKQSLTRKVLWQLLDTWNPFMYREARDVLKDEGIDILHSHKLRGLSPALWSAARAAGVKRIVHTCHDFELLSPQGLFMGRVGKMARSQSLPVRPYHAVRRWASANVSVATAPSEFTMNAHRRMGFFPGGISKVIQNTHGLDESGTRRRRQECVGGRNQGDVRRFLFMGRIDEAKGVEVLCRAFARFADTAPGLVLEIAGSGVLSEPLRAQYSGSPNIKFVGSVRGPEKDELFKRSDILVAPSLAAESFGLVIAEAFSYGLPVIASRIGAYADLVEDKITGFLVEPNSEDELFEAFSAATSAPKRVRSMGVNCFDQAARFTIEKMTEGYLDAYKSLE